MTTTIVIRTVTLLTSIIILTCGDSYTSVSLFNDRLDTVTIIAQTNVNFRTEDSLINYQELGGTYYGKTIRFKMAPKTTIECGHAINGIEDEIPFTTFKVLTGKDSFTASTQDQILSLFDKTTFGNLKIPFQLTIK